MTDPRAGWLRSALAELDRREPVDAREAASRRRFVAELDRLAQPFERDADPVHVTASAVLVGPRGVVLHRHKRLGLWLQPGGHLDPGEWPYDAALREAGEETGLFPIRSARPHAATPVAHVDVHGGGLGHVHLDVRYVVAADGEPAPAASESPDVRWFEWEEAVAVADAGLRGLLVVLAPSALAPPAPRGPAAPAPGGT